MVPPETPSTTEPPFKLLQGGVLIVSTTERGAAGTVTVPEALLTQPRASVTVTVKVPATNPDKLSVVAPPDDHR